MKKVINYKSDYGSESFANIFEAMADEILVCLDNVSERDFLEKREYLADLLSKQYDFVNEETE